MQIAGDCYRSAAKTLINHHRSEISELPKQEHVLLVHGMPCLSRPPFTRYGHAWIEYGDTVLDTETNIKMNKDVYYALGRIDPVYCAKYTINMVRWFITEYNHWGPWEDLNAFPPLGQEVNLNQIVLGSDKKDEQVLILRGLPGSGKTESINSIKHKSPVICSVAKYLSPLIKSGTRRSRKRVLRAHDKCEAEYGIHIRRGSPLIVVNNRNISGDDYLPYINYAMQYGYRAYIVELHASFKYCRKHTQKVSTQMLREMYSRWEPTPDYLYRWTRIIKNGYENVEEEQVTSIKPRIVSQPVITGEYGQELSASIR